MALRVFLTHGTVRIQRILIGSDPEEQRKWMDPLSRYLESELGAEVTQHQWSGRLFGAWNRREVARCAEAMSLAATGLAESGDTFVLIAKSNGAQLLENALLLVDPGSTPREQLVEIRVATPLRGSAVHAARIGNRYRLFSNSDGLYRQGRLVFRALFPSSDADDPALIDIELAQCSHHDFNVDTPLTASLDCTLTSVYRLFPHMINGDGVDWLRAGFDKTKVS